MPVPPFFPIFFSYFLGYDERNSLDPHAVLRVINPSSPNPFVESFFFSPPPFYRPGVKFYASFGKKPPLRFCGLTRLAVLFFVIIRGFSPQTRAPGSAGDSTFRNLPDCRPSLNSASRFPLHLLLGSSPIYDLLMLLVRRNLPLWPFFDHFPLHTGRGFFSLVLLLFLRFDPPERGSSTTKAVPRFLQPPLAEYEPPLFRAPTQAPGAGGTYQIDAAQTILLSFLVFFVPPRPCA